MIIGTAAGVPFVARPPSGGERPAAAVPLDGLDAGSPDGVRGQTRACERRR